MVAGIADPVLAAVVPALRFEPEPRLEGQARRKRTSGQNKHHDVQ
jgi:hypothetical protein